MAVKFLDNIDLVGNQLKNSILDVQAGNPTPLGQGQFFFDSTNGVKAFKYYNGTDWINPADGSFTSWTLQGDAGANQTITTGTVVDFAGGTGITTTMNGGAPGMNITNSLPFNSLTLASTTGTNSTISNTGTITIAAGTGITTTNNASGQVTIAATGSGSMSSFTLSGDAGSNQTISDGDTVDIAGGTLISTTASATDTLTVNHNNVSRSNTTATETLGAGGTFAVITAASTSGQGHVTGAETTTFTLPSASANTTYSINASAPASNVFTVNLDGSTGTDTLINFSTSDNNIALARTNAAAVTIGLRDDVVVVDDLTAGGELTIQGTGQSSFAGKVTGITPTASGDLATKGYVDTTVAGGLTVKGGFNASSGVTAVAGTNLYTNTAVAIGDYYTVTVAGNFFGDAGIPLTPGDSVLAQTAAAAGSADENDFAVIQSDTDLATLSVIGIGNVNEADGDALLGINVVYSGGTAKVGLDINAGLSNVSTLADADSFPFFDASGGVNGKVAASAIKTYMGLKGTFAGTSSSGTTHVFTHNLGTQDVIVQLFDASDFETVYASVDRTSTTVVTVTTAASADIRCVITEC